MKNILVTGANGQLGNEMRVLSLENKEYNYFFTDVAELDICDEKAVMAFVKENEIDVIVNCAAYTAVDKAEDNQELCAKLNSEAVGYLAKAAEENQAPSPMRARAASARERRASSHLSSARSVSGEALPRFLSRHR